MGAWSCAGRSGGGARRPARNKEYRQSKAAGHQRSGPCNDATTSLTNTSRPLDRPYPIKECVLLIYV